MRFLILLFLIWSKGIFSQESEERAQAKKIQELIKPFFTDVQGRHLNLRPSDFKINDVLYDDDLAENFKIFIDSYGFYEPVDLDHLKKPEEYSKLWEKFQEVSKERDLKLNNSKDVIVRECEKEFPRSNFITSHFYLLDLDLERDLLRAYKHFSTLEEHAVYAGNLCLEYFNSEIITHFLETVRGQQLPLRERKVNVPHKEFSSDAVVIDNDFKSKNEKFLFLYYLQAKKITVDSVKDLKNYQDILKKFKSNLEEIDKNLALIIKMRKNYYEQRESLKTLNKYIQLLATDKEKAIDSVEAFTKDQFAANPDDFYEKLYFACSVIHCPLNFSSPIKSKIKSENYTQFGVSIKDINSLVEPDKNRYADAQDEKLTYFDPNIISNFIKKTNKAYLLIQNIKDQSSKNHRIGYLEHKLVDGPRHFDKPGVLIFDRPDWSGRVIEIAHPDYFDETSFPHFKNSSDKSALNKARYAESGYGYIVVGKSGDWFNVGTRRGPKWVHISQSNGYIENNDHLEVGRGEVIPKTTKFYDNFKGNVVPYEKIKNNILGPKAKILEKKWAEDTLWVKVQYGFIDEDADSEKYQKREDAKHYKEENPEEEVVIPDPPSHPKIDEKDLPVLWVPVGNDDGTENFNLGFSYGC